MAPCVLSWKVGADVQGPTFIGHILKALNLMYNVPAIAYLTQSYAFCITSHV